MKRRFSLLTCFVLLFVVLVSVGVCAEEKSMIGAFDIGSGGQAEHFNPLTATAGNVWRSKMYSRLIAMDHEFSSYVGDLAKDWYVDDTGTKWRFSLRDDVLWHDGVPLTAEDVQFSFELYLTPQSGSMWVQSLAPIVGAQEFSEGQTDEIQGITLIDDLTFEIETLSPNASFLNSLARFFYVVPKHQLESIPVLELINHNWWYTEPIGSGPFKWYSYEPGQYNSLVAFDDYFLGRPKLDRITNRYFDHPVAAIAAFEAGEIDFISEITPVDALRYEMAQDVKVISAPSMTLNYLRFNHAMPEFQDVRVRQAFNYAIDRQAIVDTLFSRQAEPTAVLYPPSSIFSPEDPIAYEYNPEKAMQLIQESGLSGATFELITYYNSQLDRDVVEAMQAYLAVVGINIEPIFMDTPTYNRHYLEGDFQMTYRGSGYGPDPDTAIKPKWHSQGNQNICGYPSIDSETYARIDNAFELGMETFALEERVEHYRTVASILNKEAIDVFLWVPLRSAAVSTNIENFIWTAAPAGATFFDNAHEWDK